MPCAWKGQAVHDARMRSLQITGSGAADDPLQPGLALACSARGLLALAPQPRTQLVELCGAFDHDHVAALGQARPKVPVGLVN